jgi:hypothetical protein
MVTLFSGYAHADLNTGLMAYYNFDDCSAKDSSINGNHGTIHGNLTCNTGIANKAAVFDGNTYISVPNSPSLNPNTQLTISFWIQVKVDDYVTSYPVVIGKLVNSQRCYQYDSCGFYEYSGRNGQGTEYNVFLVKSKGVYYPRSAFGQESAGDFNSYVHSSFSRLITANRQTAARDGQWMHYIGVIDRVKHRQRIYVNAEFHRNSRDSYSGFNTNNADLAIGGVKLDTGIIGIKGALDEVRLYNRALSEDEIIKLFNQGFSVEGSINSLDTHTVTCVNETTAQSISIPTTTRTKYDCEAKGLKVNPQDDITITIKGKAQ